MAFSHMFDDRDPKPPIVQKIEDLSLVDDILKAVAAAVLRGQLVNLPGLGRFRTVVIPERRDHHPSTGAPINTPASTAIVFETSLQKLTIAVSESKSVNSPQYPVDQ